MPILVVLALTAAVAPVPWPAPPFDLGAAASLALTAVAFLLPVGGAGVLSRWAAASVRANPMQERSISRTYYRLRRLLGWANLLAAVLAVVGLGWGWAVRTRLTVPTELGFVLAPFAELLVPAPYILSLFAAWILHYDAEKALHDHNMNTALRSFWPRGGHFLFHLRRLSLVLMPVVLWVATQALNRLYPHTVEHWITQVVSLALLPFVFVLLPAAVRPVLGLKPLPAGPVRDRLEELAAKHRFRHGGLLLWPTHGEIANAMVLGILPRVRYVVLTDRLIEEMEPDELDAVFGHEVGHVKHFHIPLYAVFFVLSFLLTGVVVAVGIREGAAAWEIDLTGLDGWLLLPPLAVLAAYMFVVFGALSRVCERQADLYGCRVGGTGAMVRALRKVADLNGLDHGTPGGRWQTLRGLLRAWQHGTIAGRMGYLLTDADDPAAVRRFQRRATAVQAAVLLALMGGLAMVVLTVEWAELVRLL